MQREVEVVERIYESVGASRMPYYCDIVKVHAFLRPWHHARLTKSAPYARDAHTAIACSTGRIVKKKKHLVPTSHILLKIP
jgi:hypothetical protein